MDDDYCSLMLIVDVYLVHGWRFDFLYSIKWRSETDDLCVDTLDRRSSMK